MDRMFLPTLTEPKGTCKAVYQTLSGRSYTCGGFAQTIAAWSDPYVKGYLTQLTDIKISIGTRDMKVMMAPRVATIILKGHVEVAKLKADQCDQCRSKGTESSLHPQVTVAG
eukprot:4703513-Amphidinium_carterae.2